jgi:hypothetical protein
VVRIRHLLLVIHARTKGGSLMSGFSMMVLLMAQSVSSALVVVFIMTVSRVIITCLSVCGCGFRMTVSTVCFFFLRSTMMNSLLAVGWSGALRT